MELCWKNVLKLYLATTTDGLKKRGSMESLAEQHHWVAEEAEYQVYKHQQLRIV